MILGLSSVSQMKASSRIGSLMALLTLTLLLTGCSRSTQVFEKLEDGSCNQSQKRLVAKHISGQVEAIAQGDWEKAIQYSSPNFQANVMVENFRDIIELNYRMIIENDRYSFSQCQISENSINQGVKFIAAGQSYNLTYQLVYEDKRLGIEAAG